MKRIRLSFIQNLRYQIDDLYRQQVNRNIARKCINCSDEVISSTDLKIYDLDGINYVTGGNVTTGFTVSRPSGGIYQKTGSTTPIVWRKPSVWIGPPPQKTDFKSLLHKSFQNCSPLEVPVGNYYRAVGRNRQKCIESLADEMEPELLRESFDALKSQAGKGLNKVAAGAIIAGVSQCTPTTKGSSIEFPECQYEITLNVIEQQGSITNPETGEVYEANGVYADSYCKIGTIAMSSVATTPGPPIAPVGGPGKYRLNKVTYKYSGFRTHPSPYGDVVRPALQEGRTESPGPWKEFTTEAFQGKQDLYYNWGAEDEDITPTNAGYSLPAEAFRGGACPTSPEQSAATLKAMLEIAYNLLLARFLAGGLTLEVSLDGLIREAGTPPPDA